MSAFEQILQLNLIQSVPLYAPYINNYFLYHDLFIKSPKHFLLLFLKTLRFNLSNNGLITYDPLIVPNFD